MPTVLRFGRSCYTMPKVLIILSDAHAFPLQKKDGTVVEEETGFFLMELAKPLSKLLDAGFEVTVSPRPPVNSLALSNSVHTVRFTRRQAPERRPTIRIDLARLPRRLVGEEQGERADRAHGDREQPRLPAAVPRLI